MNKDLISKFIYFSKFNNAALKELLINKDNLPPLEFLLDSEAKKLQKLQKTKPDFGPKVSKKKLSPLFSAVKNEVDSFLDVTEIDTPEYNRFTLLKPSLRSVSIMLNYSCGYYFLLTGALGLSQGNFFGILPVIMGFALTSLGKTLYRSSLQPGYNRKTKSINLSKQKRTRLITLMAHEYTHHVQQRSVNLKNKNLESVLFLATIPFMEGHARGVERHISNTYREKEDNEVFLYNITDETVGELKSAYQWICERLFLTSKQSLLKQPTSRDKVETYYRKNFNQPTPHTLGNTLLYLCEAQRGKEIYKQVLNRTFTF